MDARSCFWICLALCSLGWSSRAEAWQWGRWRFNLRLQLVMEYDTNVRRLGYIENALLPDEQAPRWGQPTSGVLRSPLPPIEIKGDGVHKLGTEFKFRYRNRRHIWQLQYILGLKRYFLTGDENTMISRGLTRYYLRVARRFYLGATIQAADRRRDNQTREYSLFRGQFHALWFAPARWRIEAYGGYQSLQYRNLEEVPESRIDGFTDGQRFSFTGDQYVLSARRRWWKRRLTSTLSYDFSRLFYDFRYRQVTPVAPEDPSIVGILDPRTDLRHGATLKLQLLYKVLFQASYRFEVLSSDSISESYIGHLLQAQVTTELFWDIYLLVKGQFTFRTYTDGLIINDPSRVGDADENLTALTVILSRSLLKRLRLSLRYSYFANQFGSGNSTYNRQTLSVGLTLRY